MNAPITYHVLRECVFSDVNRIIALMVGLADKELVTLNAWFVLY